MKPPVEEPISRQTLPATSMAKCAQRAGQFEAAAAHVGRPREHFDGGIGVDGLAGLGRLLAVEQHLAGHDEGLGLLARFGEAAVHQQAVEPVFIESDVVHDLRWTIRSASSCRRAARLAERRPAPGGRGRIPPPPCGAMSPGRRPRET